MIRTSFFIFMFLVISCTAFAQTETLFSGEIDHGGFGGVNTSFSQVNGELAVMFGGYGAWLINSRFALGGGGFGTANAIKYDETPLGNRYINFDYAGFYTEYILKPEKLFHLTFSAFVGGGEVNMSYDDGDGDELFEGDNVFVLDPRVNVELNVTSYMRLMLGAGYRFVSGVDLLALENSDFSGPSLNLSVRFGSF